MIPRTSLTGAGGRQQDGTFARKTEHSTRTTVRLLRALIVFCAALSSTMAAQDPDLGSASMEDLMKVQVYAASRYLQSTSSAPAFVTVVTRDEIQRFGYRTLADALQNVTGFYVTYDRNYSYVGVRGFGRPGDYNTRILLLVNGHRINDSVYQGALIGNEFPVDVELIDRIEVIRGPGSAVYGTNAFFGVINVVTIAPENTTERLEASAEGASFGLVRGRMQYSGKCAALTC